MMKKLIPAYFILLALCFANSAKAQRKPVAVSQVDARFTVSVERYWSSLGGSEEYYYYVKNNTSQEYKMVINVTVQLACVGTKSYTLGVNKNVYLPANGSFTPKDDWVHILNSGADNFKDCRLKDGDSFTLYKGLSYNISNIVNVTEEKAAAAKKKSDSPPAKPQAVAASPTTQSKTPAKKDATVTAPSAPAANTAVAASVTSNTTDKETAKKQRTDGAAQAQANERDAAARREDERKRQEEEKKQDAQRNYDSWKAGKKQEQIAAETAAVGTSFDFLWLVGGIVYDGMGDVNPDYVFKPGKKLQLYGGIDFGFSGAAFPSIFASKTSTMVSGNSVSKTELIPKDLYHINLSVVAKIGAEHPNYGGFIYFAPQAGFSPVFDGYNFSPLSIGGQVFGGFEAVQLFGDYAIGSRSYSSSSNDAEESGTGKSEYSYTKITGGLKFTTNPNSNYTRSHILLGVINEQITVDYDQAFVDPGKGFLVKKGKSKFIRGYSFQWKKDHTFNFFVNAYPEYAYTGEALSTSGGLSKDFTSKKTGLFLEIGFLRSIDFW